MFAKICGITRAEDALHAVAHGATVLGFVFWPRSPRYVTAAQVRAIVDTLPDGILKIGVFVDEPVESIQQIVETAGLTGVQINGDMEPATAGALRAQLFKVVTLGGAADAIAQWPATATLLLDAHDPVRRGGTGMTVDWQEAATIAAQRRLVLAGGLTPANVGAAIGIVRPFGVDVCSGVEASPGIKDPGKVAEFLSNARLAFERSKDDVRGND